MFSVFLSVHRPPPRSRSRGHPGQGLSQGPGGHLGQGPGGPPGQGQGPGGPPWSRSGGAPWSRSGGPPGQGPGQGLRGALVMVQVKIWGGGPRSRSGPPTLSRSKNAGSAGGTPLAVTQEDCLVLFNFQREALLRQLETNRLGMQAVVEELALHEDSEEQNYEL